jgi:tetratricopeptide (TPR) repeat protein
MPELKALIPARIEADSPADEEEQDIDLPMALIASAVCIVCALIIGAAFMSSVALSMSEKNALLNTLLFCDIVIFCAAALSVALLWYLSSAFYGNMESRSPLRSWITALCGALILMPVVFIGCDLVFKPELFELFDAMAASALSLAGAISSVVLLVYTINSLKPGAMIGSLIEEAGREHASAGIERSFGSVAARQTEVPAATRLEALLKRLYVSGDIEPVFDALNRLKGMAMALKAPFDPKAISLSSTAVSLIAEAGVESAKEGRYEVTWHAVDCLARIAERSTHAGVSSLAFRCIGSIHVFCASVMSEPDLAKLENKLIGAYATLFDRTGRRECLDLASAMLEKSVASRTFTQGEHNDMLLMAASVYCRMAEAGESEEYANKALEILYEALSASPPEVNPIAYALVKAEIGRAYMALGKAKSAVKSYKSAAQAFEESCNALTARASPWDLASCHGKAAYAYTKMAEEYSHTRKYDEALEAAKQALALYGESARFFTARRSAEEHATLMANLGATHTIISEVFSKSRMFDESLKHASFALTAYSSAAKSANMGAVPERYASMKTSIGLTYVTMAEIHFREQHYESAISACDSAIAAYNEALRIFDDKKKEKSAAAARRYLKKANDLFNTMMRIGVTDKKPEQAPLLVGH